jgi:hypothetical protein
MWDGNSVCCDTGRVLVYRWNSSQYVHIRDFQGSQTGNWWGESVALSYNGNRLALSEPRYDSIRGRVLIYDTNTGASLGEIWGNPGDRWGQSLDLSDSGDRIIIGGSFTGEVKVYQYNSGWTQLGTTLTGSGGSRGFGWSVAMDSSGNRVAIGAPEAIAYS